MSENEMRQSNNIKNEEPAPADETTASAPESAAEPETATSAVSDELLETQRKRDEYYDQLQRARAEFANYQKRARAQADADRAYAVVPLALDLIGVLDNFERAADAARNAGAASIVEGLDMVRKQLISTLAKHGIEPISALGQQFDPNLHEAISQMPDEEHPEGIVLAEHAKGYHLLDRVLRPAKVVVSVKPK
jgi:molecular chaperone GrpE